MVKRACAGTLLGWVTSWEVVPLRSYKEKKKETIAHITIARVKEKKKETIAQKSLLYLG